MNEVESQIQHRPNKLADLLGDLTYAIYEQSAPEKSTEDLEAIRTFVRKTISRKNIARAVETNNRNVEEQVTARQDVAIRHAINGAPQNDLSIRFNFTSTHDQGAHNALMKHVKE